MMQTATVCCTDTAFLVQAKKTYKEEEPQHMGLGDI